ncbi:hypothetical protein ISN44_As06g032810, partial [Arabidopsis suecica]
LLLNFLQLSLPFSQIHDFFLGSSENLRFVRKVSEVREGSEIEPVRLMSTRTSRVTVA